MTQTLFVFDVDDTLYFERDYSRSALMFLGELLADKYNIENVGSELLTAFNGGDGDAIGGLWLRHALPTGDKEDCLLAMQQHMPSITLRSDAERFLADIRASGSSFALVTDGRSGTQRNKIEALGLCDAAVICISGETGFQKPAPQAFAKIVDFADTRPVVFVGDNPKKDFWFANQIGWTSVMLLATDRNVHPQILPQDTAFHPQITISDFSELEKFKYDQ
jgi:putative hydrolase of the HAD superfamily